MKTSKFFFLGLLSLGVAFSSCSSDDDEPAGTCSTPTDIIIDNATVSSVTLSWVSSGSAWTIEYGESGFTQGSGTQVAASANPYTINGLEANTNYDFYVRNNCADGASGFSSVATFSTPTTLAGTWEAYDVSPLLAGAGITGITAKFTYNNKYRVDATTGGSDLVFEGTYTVSQPNAEGIYAITLEQTDPEPVTSQGIFKVYVASPDSMWYEVAQTTPAQAGVTPPTQGAGFGSTSGGAYGNALVQKYTRQ